MPDKQPSPASRRTTAPITLACVLALAVVLVWIPWPAYRAVSNLVVTHWRVASTLLLFMGLTSAVVHLVRARQKFNAQAESGDKSARTRVRDHIREMPEWSIWVGMAGLILVGVIATWWLVAAFGMGTEQDKIKLEAIKLAGSIAVGTGGVAALLLAARRQRVSELDLLQRDQVAVDNWHDANERRATELYTAAADQLGSDKAAVRMAGMYALSRLGQNNKDLRQTIINLLCAYLRMPDISLPGIAPSSNSPDEQERSIQQARGDTQSGVMLDLAPAPLAALAALSPDTAAQEQQEREVRLTAQRLLAQHLRPDRGDDSKPTNRLYWPEIDIDLSGATLHNWHFTGCDVRSASFSGARFYDFAEFDRAHFRESVSFNCAYFRDSAEFNGTQFHHSARFSSAQFDDAASFTGAQFHGFAWFDDLVKPVPDSILKGA